MATVDAPSHLAQQAVWAPNVWHPRALHLGLHILLAVLLRFAWWAKSSLSRVWTPQAEPCGHNKVVIMHLVVRPRRGEQGSCRPT